jgi:1,4-dihydroxy-2-naphthoyl-CoA hydrolase
MMADRMGIRMATLGEGFARGELDVTDEVRQPAGVLHGGALVTLADTVASVGAIAAAPPGRTVLTVALSVAFMRAVHAGTVVAEGRELHRGSEFTVWDVDVRERDGRLVARVMVTLCVRPWADARAEAGTRRGPTP